MSEEGSILFWFIHQWSVQAGPDKSCKIRRVLNSLHLQRRQCGIQYEKEESEDFFVMLRRAHYWSTKF